MGMLPGHNITIFRTDAETNMRYTCTVVVVVVVVVIVVVVIIVVVVAAGFVARTAEDNPEF